MLQNGICTQVTWAVVGSDHREVQSVSAFETVRRGSVALPYGVIVNVLLAMNVSLPMSTTVST